MCNPYDPSPSPNGYYESAIAIDGFEMEYYVDGYVGVSNTMNLSAARSADNPLSRKINAAGFLLNGRLHAWENPFVPSSDILIARPLVDQRRFHPQPYKKVIFLQ
jgi:hypothetical protein